jgi:hypothetical protein
MKLTESQLRAMIREQIKNELEEISASGAAAGFDSPNAFAKGNSVFRKKLGQTAGYTLSPKTGEEGGKVDEARSHYDLYKADESATPKQKLGRAIAEINRQMNEIDKVIGMNARLKQETNTSSSGMWKRTMKHLSKMESRMISLSNKIRELKA